MKVIWFILATIAIVPIVAWLDITAATLATQVYPYVSIHEWLLWAAAAAIATLAALVLIVRLFIAAVRPTPPPAPRQTP